MVRTIPLYVLALFGLLGCSSREPLPTLYPVSGQAVKNGVPVKGGVISLVKLNEQRPYIINGVVNDGGQFELATLDDRTRRPGVPAGEYHVTYSPPVLGKDAFPVTLAQTIEITSKDNKLTIDIAAAD